MKKLLIVLSILAIVSCSKEETTLPQTDQVCLTCLDSISKQTVTICDDTLTVRVWSEYFDFQNKEHGAGWTCKKN